MLAFGMLACGSLARYGHIAVQDPSPLSGMPYRAMPDDLA
jgi:hypothetical protein